MMQKRVASTKTKAKLKARGRQAVKHIKQMRIDVSMDVIDSLNLEECIYYEVFEIMQHDKEIYTF